MPEVNIQGIMDLLPHRYPFLLVDRIVDLEPGKKVIGIKNVTINEQFFQGHFPALPIMPAVLVVEAIAQVGAYLALKSTEGRKRIVYFTGMEHIKFRRPVVPGDQMRIEVDVIARRGDFWRLHGEARVNGDVAVKGNVTAMVSEGKQGSKI